MRTGSRWRRLRLAALTGALLGFSFPPFPLGWFAFCGLVPLLMVLEETEDVRGALGYGYVAMFVFHVVTLNWTGGYVHMRDPYMMLAGALTIIVHPLFYFLPIGAYVLARRTAGSSAALLLLPLFWVGYEYSHTLSEWSFPWLTLAHSQSYDPARIQFIAVTGVWGLSLWILVMNVLAFLAVKGILREGWKTRAALRPAAALVILAVLPSVHGSMILSGAPRVADGGLVPGERTVTVGMVQSNVDPWEKWTRDPASSVGLYLERTRLLAARTPAPDIVFWPETAVNAYILTDPGAGMLAAMRAGIGVPVLTGLQHAVFYTDSARAPRSARRARATGARYDVFNAAALITPGSGEVRWYGKRKMVPFAERVPYADAFSFLDFLRWDVGIGGWQIGPEEVVFEEPRTGARFPALICYESTYPGFVASFVRNGAEFLGLITIDSWWGRMSGAFQHHQIAVFRAVENRRWVARCAVGGISSYLDPYGRVYDATELFTEANLSRTIGRGTELTFYTSHGDWLGMGCLAGGLVSLPALLLRRRRSPRGAPRLPDV